MSQEPSIRVCLDSRRDPNACLPGSVQLISDVEVKQSVRRYLAGAPLPFEPRGLFRVARPSDRSVVGLGRNSPAVVILDSPWIDCGLR